MKQTILIALAALLVPLLGGCRQAFYEEGRTAYRISFDTGASLIETGAAPTIDTAITVYAGDVMDRLPEPAWTGYTFRGWYDTPEDGGKIEAPWTPAGDRVLYAYWGSGASGADDYKIIFNAGDGVFEGGQKTLEKYIRRPPWTVINMPIAKKEGNAFGGWYTQTGGAGNEFTAVTTVTEFTGGVGTLYSNWIASNASFTVTFKTYGGKWADNTGEDKQVTVSVNDDGVILVGDQVPAEPVLEGFVSTGWFTQMGTQTVPFSGHNFINKNLTVFPVWDIGPGFIPPEYVTFELTEAGIAGTDSNGVGYSTTVTEGTSFTEEKGKKVAVFADKNVSRVNLHRMTGKYFSGEQWSLEMYIKLPNIKSNSKILEFSGEAGLGQAGSFWVEDSSSAHRLLFRAFPRGSEELAVGDIPTQNTWVHIAYVKNGSTLTCYMNGDKKGASDSFGVFSGNAAFNNITNCRFGNVNGAMLYQFTMRNSAPALNGEELSNKLEIKAVVDSLNTP
jgi:hypothetical protein